MAVKDSRIDLLKTLAELGADVDAEDENRKKADDLARGGNRLEIVTFLNTFRKKGRSEPVFF
jgi:hypothetical protein